MDYVVSDGGAWSLYLSRLDRAAFDGDILISPTSRSAHHRVWTARGAYRNLISKKDHTESLKVYQGNKTQNPVGT